MRPQFGSAAEERRLDQRRIADRAGHGGGLAIVPGAAHGQTDRPGRAFAVAHQGHRQRQHGGLERLLEDGQRRAGHGHARGAVGQAEDHVVGRLLAVDRDAVEGARHDPAQQVVERRLGDDRVGGHEAQRRRHARRDHAGALGGQADAHRPLAGRRDAASARRPWACGRWCGWRRRSRGRRRARAPWPPPRCRPRRARSAAARRSRRSRPRRPLRDAGRGRRRRRGACAPRRRAPACRCRRWRCPSSRPRRAAARTTTSPASDAPAPPPRRWW